MQINKYEVRYKFHSEENDKIIKFAFAEVSGPDLTVSDAKKLFFRTHPDTKIIFIRRKLK